MTCPTSFPACPPGLASLFPLSSSPVASIRFLEHSRVFVHKTFTHIVSCSGALSSLHWERGQLALYQPFGLRFSVTPSEFSPTPLCLSRALVLSPSLSLTHFPQDRSQWTTANTGSTGSNPSQPGITRPTHRRSAVNYRVPAARPGCPCQQGSPSALRPSEPASEELPGGPVPGTS